MNVAKVVGGVVRVLGLSAGAMALLIAMAGGADQAGKGAPRQGATAGEGDREKVIGLWHRSGCNRRAAPGTRTVYGGPHATYCAWTRPMAVYVPGQDKTFFVFGNAENSPTISAYAHATQTFSPAVVLGRNRDKDGHRNPHLLVDETGGLYVFYGSHCSPTYLVKSARPYDISEWVPMGVVMENSSYPQPWQLQRGEIVVLFRQGGTHNAAEAIVRSADGGKTWSSPAVIAASPPKNGLYAVSIAAGGPYPRRLHMAWSVTRGDWWQRYHVYYAVSDDGGRTWKQSDGRPYRLPIAESEAQLVFRSAVPDRGVWLQDIQLDRRGNPYVLFVDANTLSYDCTWRVARCLDGQWTIHPLAPAGHMYTSGALVFLADDDLRAYLPSTPSQPHEDGGDVDEWRSTDRGLTWTKTRPVTSGSRYAHNHVKTVYGHQKGDFRVFWSYGDSRDPPETRAVDLFCYGESLPAPRQIPLRYARP
jgi:hypothetical protein